MSGLFDDLVKLLDKNYVWEMLPKLQNNRKRQQQRPK